MNIRYFSCYACLGITLVAVASCDSSSGDNPFNKTVQDNQTYLVYESDQALYAVNPKDPKNPVVIDSADNTLSYPYFASSTVNISDASETSLLVDDSLLYAKDGRIWQVNTRLDSELAATQVSSEDSAFDICYARMATIDETLFYNYTLPGPDNNCYTPAPTDNNESLAVPVLSDNIVKWVATNADAMTTPSSGGINFYFNYRPPNQLLYYDFSKLPQIDVSGLLVFNNATGELLWFEGTNFTMPAYTVANNITSFRVAFLQNDITYLLLDGNLYRYQAKDTHLEQSLYTTESSDIDSFGYDNNTIPTRYFIDGQKLFKMEVDTGKPPVLLFSNSKFDQTLRFFQSSPTYFVLYKQFIGYIVLYTVNKLNGELKELITIQSLEPQPHYSNLVVDKNFYYYSDDIKSEVGYVSVDGQIKDTVPNSKIVGRVTNPVSKNKVRSTSHLLLAQPAINNKVKLVLFDLKTKRVEQELGLLPADSADYSLRTSLPNNGFILLSAHVDQNWEIFFADLKSSGSLLRLTHNNIHDSIVFPGNLGAPPPIPTPPPPTGAGTATGPTTGPGTGTGMGAGAGGMGGTGGTGGGLPTPTPTPTPTT